MTESEFLRKSLQEASQAVEKKINELLPQDFSDSNLVSAMRYSCLASGKRIRPFLLISCANIFGASIKDSIYAAAAIELIHNYSLIHDDLPAMDNDDFRRNLPTCHKKFDEATAILAGDSLLTYAFEILANPKTHINATIRCQLIAILAKSSGFLGMAGGQMIDLEKADQKISNEELTKLHRLKTGELFMAAAEMGAVIGGATISERNHLRNFAHDLGLAFQIKDDILDHVEILHEEVSIDEMNHKKKQENASIVDVIGLTDANSRLKILKDQALCHLEIFGKKAEILRELTNFTIFREK